MIPYYVPPDPPYENNGNDLGRPPGRLEVHQHFLDHKKNQYRDLQHVNRRIRMPLGGPVMNLRNLLGNLLITVGQWMSGASARNAAGSQALARR